MDDLKEKFEELFNEMSEKVEAGKQEAKEMYNRGKDGVDEFKKDVKSHMS